MPPRSRLPFKTVLALSCTAIFALAAQAFAFDVYSFKDSPENCAVSAGLVEDTTVQSVIDLSALRYPPDQTAVPLFMSWISAWTRQALDVSDLAKDKSHVCVGLYQDVTGNARATQDLHIFYGLKKFREFNEPRFGGEKGWSAQALLAHEWGHTLQFAHGLSFARQRTYERAELHADCIAGFIMEVMLHPVCQQPDKYRHSLRSEFHDMGDMAFQRYEHHGTPDERENAFAKGMALGEQALITGALPLPSRRVVDACEALYQADPRSD